MTWPRVTATPGALYGKPRTSRKRRRCDGHLADRHWIAPGEQFVPSALPPDTGDVGNVGWWHAAFCMACAPVVDGVSP